MVTVAVAAPASSPAVGIPWVIGWIGGVLVGLGIFKLDQAWRARRGF
jgi:hypothetical protein